MNTITFNELLQRELTHHPYGGSKLVQRTIDDCLQGKGAKAVLPSLNEDREHPFCGITDWANAALVDFVHSMPGLAEATPIRVVFLQQWFTEVLPQTAPTPEAIHQRLVTVEHTGFLPVGPGEQVALFYRYPSGAVNVAIYRCDDAGNAFVVRGCDWVESVERWADQGQRSVSSLNEKETRDQIQSHREFMLCRLPEEVSACDHELMERQLQLLEAHLKVAPPERTASGAVVRRWFIENGNTGSIASITPSSEGWTHYETFQDAWYFAVRMSPLKREIITYAEQDVRHVLCGSDEQFFVELEALAEFYGHHRTPCAVSYEMSGARTCFYSSLYLLAGKTHEVKLKPVVEAKPEGEDTSKVVPLFMAINTSHAALQGLDLNQEVRIPGEAYQLDLYNPVSFKPSTAVATLTAEGFDISVEIDGETFTACLDLRVSETEVQA